MHEPKASLYPFLLISDSPEALPPEIDVIFINGMLGSVFHTWRQRDSCNLESEESGAPENGEHVTTVNCWPQVGFLFCFFFAIEFVSCM